MVSFLPGPYRVPHYRGQALGRRDQQGADGAVPRRGPAGVHVRDGSAPRSRRPPSRHGSGRRQARQPHPRRRAALSLAVGSRLGLGELHGIAGAARARRSTMRAVAHEQRREAGARAAHRHRHRVLRRADRRRLGHSRVARRRHRDGNRGRHRTRRPSGDGDGGLRPRLPRPGARDDAGAGRRAGARRPDRRRSGSFTATRTPARSAAGPTRAGAR